MRFAVAAVLLLALAAPVLAADTLMAGQLIPPGRWVLLTPPFKVDWQDRVIVDDTAPLTQWNTATISPDTAPGRHAECLRVREAELERAGQTAQDSDSSGPTLLPLLKRSLCVESDGANLRVNPAPGSKTTFK